MQVSRTQLLVLAHAAVAAASATAALGEGPYESHPVLEAKRLLPAEQLEGASYSIEPTVTSEDFVYRFEIVTPSGRYFAERLGYVPTRLREADALAILAERSAGEVVAESAGDAVEGAAGSVVKVVQEPGETARGAAGGVGRWAKRTVLGARKLAHDVKEGIEDAGDEGEGDAEPDQPSATADATGSGDAPEPEPNAAAETAKVVGKFVLGYAGARREYAAGLGVDPYTRNPVLAAELDRVAWSASSGRFGAGMMIPDLPLTPEARTAYDLVWKHHPRDLEVRNRKIADEWGVDRETRDRFFWNDAWTPTEQTAFVEAVASLGATPGKRTLMEAAAAVVDPVEVARRVADVELLARLHASGRRFARVEAAEGCLWALGGDDVIVPFAVDHVVWTRELETLLRGCADHVRRDGEARQRGLVVSGVVSERARAALAAEGWKVGRERRPLRPR